MCKIRSYFGRKLTNQAKNKVSKIVESAGFYPLISKKNNNNFVFTIDPYKIPDFFTEKQASSRIPSDIGAPLTLKKVDGEANYLKNHEIAGLLEGAS